MFETSPKAHPAQMPDAAPLLRIRGLHVEGERDGIVTPIVNGIDLTLRRGEVLGLIGESGAGKSTIGLAAMGYAKPGCTITAGSVEFDGRDLLALDPRAQRRVWGTRIAYVAQSAAAAFNPAHTLGRQCSETLVRHGLKRREAAAEVVLDLFRLLRLPDPVTIARRYPHQVSGGQLQRAMTAMAMSCRPDLIVFDEPTTALDVTTQIGVLAAIKGLVRQFGTSAIYISHDLAVVAQMAERIMVLKNGRLVEEASTGDMIARPREEYTRTLWAVRKLERPGRPGGEPLLSLRGVDAAYGSARILHGIDIDVPRGRTVAVVGESGSGKSTLAKVVAGLLPPVVGEMTLGGTILPPRLRGRSRELLRRIQMIHQMPDTALNPRRTVGSILGRPLFLHFGMREPERGRRVSELLEMVDLAPMLARRLPSELSGGQKQRVAIARALAVKPDLIICDEITSAMDQIVAEGVLRLLDKLQRELDLACLFITHDIATVRAVADHVVVMQYGRIVEQGPKDAVLSPPYDPYTALLLASVPEMRVGWLDEVLESERAAAALAGHNE